MKRSIRHLLGIVLVLAAAQPVSSFSPSFQVVSAKACFVMDDKESVLYARNPSVKLPPASTVKLVTAMVTLDRLAPDALVKVSRAAAATRSIKPRLQADDELTVSDLLHLALMKSINAAAVALAEEVAGSEEAFVAQMNRKAEEIGACDTHFITASGLPKGKQYTTARDLAVIMKRALLSADQRDPQKKGMADHDNSGAGALSGKFGRYAVVPERHGRRQDGLHEQRTALFCRRHGYREGAHLYRGPRRRIAVLALVKRPDAGRAWNEPGPGDLIQGTAR